MHRSPGTLILGAGLGLALGACGGESTAPTAAQTELTSQEAAQLTDELIEAVVTGLGAGLSARPTASPTAALDPVPIDVTIDHAHDCPGGGAVEIDGAITGSIDDATLSGDLALDVNGTITACSIPHGETDIVVDGALDLLGSFAWENGRPEGEQSLTFEASFTYASNGRTGSCSIEARVQWSMGGGSSWSGRACNHDIGNGTAPARSYAY